MGPHSGNVEYTNGSSGESFSNTSDTDLVHQLQQANSNNDASSTAAAALAAEFGAQNNGMSFVSNGSNANLDRHLDASFDLGADTSQNHDSHGPSYSDFGSLNPVGTTAAQVHAVRESANNNPKVGSEEWRKIRRDNHKEVERRRRETINEGINEIAKIVPGSEKNKGAILQTAVSYILHLKSTQDDTIEKRTMEKVVMDQALSELSSSNEELRASLKHAWTENERLRNKLREAGLEADDAPGEGDGVGGLNVDG